MSASVYDFLVFNNNLSFELYPSNIIGTKFENVIVLGLLDIDTAKGFIDPVAMHVNVYPTLPPGVPDNPSQYQYLKVRHANGSISVIGIPWIKEDTLLINNKGTLTLVIDHVTPIDRERIIRALSANGYKASKVSLR